MRFVVTGKAIDPLPVPPEQAIEAFRATFELLAAAKDPRIAEVYPHAEERATTFIIEAETAEDLRETLCQLPAYFLSTWESHAVTRPDHVVDVLGRMQAQLGGVGR
jgi:hypothetical protein